MVFTGSQDGTKRELELLRGQLGALGIAHSIVADESPKHFGRRSPYLAEVRNRALLPLRDSPASTNGTDFDVVLFFNDVVFKVQRADAPPAEGRVHGADLVETLGGVAAPPTLSPA